MLMYSTYGHTHVTCNTLHMHMLKDQSWPVQIYYIYIHTTCIYICGNVPHALASQPEYTPEHKECLFESFGGWFPRDEYLLPKKYIPYRTRGQYIDTYIGSIEQYHIPAICIQCAKAPPPLPFRSLLSCPLLRRVSTVVYKQMGHRWPKTPSADAVIRFHKIRIMCLPTAGPTHRTARTNPPLRHTHTQKTKAIIVIDILMAAHVNRERSRGHTKGHNARPCGL